MFGGTVVLVLMSQVRSVEQLMVCRLLQGALTGTIAANVALVASVTPARRTGYALGMMQSAVYVGMSVGPVIGGVIADQYGYRAAFLAGAVMLLLGGLLALFGMREEFVAPAPGKKKSNARFVDILAASGFLAAVFAFFSIRFSNTVANPAFPLIVMDMYTGKAALGRITGSIIGCAGVAAALSAGYFGRYSDKWGHKRMLLIFTACTGVVLVAHAFVHSVAQMFVVRTLFGLTSAGMMPAANALVCRTVGEKNVGKAYGLANSVGSLGWLLGPLTGGYLAGAFGLRLPFVMAGILQGVVLIVVGVAVKDTATAVTEPSLDSADRRECPADSD